MGSQYLCKKDLRVHFGDAVTAAINLEDVRQTLLVELKKASHLVPGAMARLDREPIGTDRP